MTDHINTLWPQLSWQERLDALRALQGERIVLSTSFSHEDQLMTQHIATTNLPIALFTLDTGRLFPETLDVMDQTEKQYGVAIERFYPNANAVENYIAERGLDGFYDSLENRKACCHMRKVEPLQRALKDAAIWISGVRHAHSANRAELPFAQWDETHQVVKLYPLLDMADDVLASEIAARNIPTNALYARGFTSIGCAPCTRATAPGEDPRAGRWWWENEDKRECGLHIVDGKLVRVEAQPHA